MIFSPWDREILGISTTSNSIAAMARIQKEAGHSSDRELPAEQGHLMQSWKGAARPLFNLLPTTAVVAVAILGFEALLLGEPASNTTSKLRTGKEIFSGGCITCHGSDGKGMPKPSIGFEPPSTFPDFTDCNATTREPNRDWKAIITYGGPARGFSEIMPSFAEALTSEQIEMAIQFLRGFCREASWPPGELNLPRALITEKAFIEDETVVTTAINAK